MYLSLQRPGQTAIWTVLARQPWRMLPKGYVHATSILPSWLLYQHFALEGALHVRGDTWLSNMLNLLQKPACFDTCRAGRGMHHLWSKPSALHRMPVVRVFQRRLKTAVPEQDCQAMGRGQ